jgi:hypothetical protein
MTEDQTAAHTNLTANGPSDSSSGVAETSGSAAAPTYGGPVHHPGAGPVGKPRGTGMAILLVIVTFGIYALVWYYLVHEELKKHSGQGVGGVVALLLAVFVGPVMPYLTAHEVGGLYERAGQDRPVSAVTGLWYFPGMLIVIGPLVWFIKTNGALNSYWRSLGAS